MTAIHSVKTWYKRQDARYKLFLVYAVKVLVAYFFFDTLITVYVGLVTPGGSLQSPLIMQLNILDGLVQSIVWGTYYLLQLLQYHAFAKGIIVGIVGTGGVEVAYYCIGYYVWMTVAVLVACFPGKWRGKLLYILACICCIHIVNIIRISLLAILAQYEVNLEDHHAIYNYVIYGITALMFLAYVDWFSDYNNTINQADTNSSI